MRDLELILPDIAGIAVYPPGASYGPRVMRDYEFVWMLEGDAEYTWGESVVSAPQGSLVLCRPGVTDHFRWDPQRRTRHAFFHFQIQSLPRAWPPGETWPLVRLLADDELVSLLFRAFTTYSETAADVARLAAEELLAAYVHDALGVRELPSAPLPTAVAAVWNAIQTQLDADPAAVISLASLARDSGVTPEHLCRQFTSATGRSPMRTVAAVRLDRAAVFITRSDDPIAVIAERCGYANPFHFSRAFRKAFGRSPSEVRRDAQEQGIAVSRLGILPPRVRGR